MQRILSARLVFVLALTVLVSIVGLVPTTTVSADTPTAVLTVAGNPKCSDYGLVGYKIDDVPASGSYTTSDGYLTFTLDVNNPYLSYTVTSDAIQGGFDIVIMKGGQAGGNLYFYNEGRSGSGLVTPNNPNGQPAGISHVEFCYDYDLSVSKTATSTFTRTYKWTIVKDADADYVGFVGDSWVHPYAISILPGTPAYVDSNFGVAGVVTISNPSPLFATVTSVTDSLNTGESQLLACTSSIVPAGGSVTCSYTFLNVSQFANLNTATVVVSTPFFSSTATGTVSFNFTIPTTEVNKNPTFVDDNGTPSDTSDDHSSSNYTRNYSCPTNVTYTDGKYTYSVTNRATLNTGESDTATVTVTCYALTVTKTANAGYTRTHTWSIDKSADGSYEGFASDSFNHDYVVKVDKTTTDSAFAVSGTITIKNPAPMDANLSGVTDSFGGTLITVSCPSVVPANGQLDCAYTLSLGDTKPADGTNTATATLTNSTSFSGTAEVKFGDPTTVVGDNAVAVSDTQSAVPSGSVSDDQTFNYSKTFTCPTDLSLYDANGVYTPADNVNTASITGPNTNLSDTATVKLTCYVLLVSKTANAGYTRTYTWTIDKSADGSYTGFAGDSFNHDYVVKVDKTTTDSAYTVSGTITVKNPAPMDANLSGVTDSFGGTLITVSCPSVVPANGQLDCAYTLSLGDTKPADGTNTATATLTNSTSFSGTAEVKFGDPTTVVGDNAVAVSDTQSAVPSGSVSDDQTFNYSKTFTCPTDLSLYDANGVYTPANNVNTASITGPNTNLSDTATVKLNCYALLVSKDATPTYTRTWSWTITKTGDQTALTLSAGQQFLVNYKVVVTAAKADTDFAVAGSITVKNPATIDATLASVTDVVSPDISASVDCGVTFPYTLAAGDKLVCSYTAALSDAAKRVNTATATLQNSPSGTTAFTGTADVTFGDPTTETDECVNVSDDKYGALGTVCASESPKTFTYSMNVGPYSICGTYTFTNVASFVTNDTGTTGSDDHTVNVTVPCGGCTLTPGYWKTHNPSFKGGAKPDDTWLLLGDVDGDGKIEGELETFFKSGMTYYQVMWTPAGGNVYYILARAYIAAKLNILNGAATTPDVTAALTAAETFFKTYTPTQAGALKNTVRNTYIKYASTLDQYNNGLIGPGHCSEDKTSASN